MNLPILSYDDRSILGNHTAHVKSRSRKRTDLFRAIEVDHGAKAMTDRGSKNEKTRVLPGKSTRRFYLSNYHPTAELAQ